MKTPLFVSILGWYGMVAILLALFLVSFEVVTPTNLIYIVLNITGGFGLVIQTYTKKDWPPLVLNAVFCLIALASLVRGLI